METKEEKALKHAQQCWGIYFDDTDEDCNTSRGEICLEDYLAGYEQCETDYDALKQRHDGAMELLGELKIDLTILKNNLSFEATQNFRFEGMPETIQKWNEKIETLINKNK